MKLAVKFYSQVDNPFGFPAAYPAECKELPDNAEIPEGFTEMSVSELEELKAFYSNEVRQIQEANNI